MRACDVYSISYPEQLLLQFVLQSVHWGFNQQLSPTLELLTCMVLPCGMVKKTPTICLCIKRPFTRTVSNGHVAVP